MPSVATAGGVQVIHGDTVGDVNQMSIKVDGVPADALAAKPGSVFWTVPSTTSAGAHEVEFTPGPGRPALKFRMYVLGLLMTINHPDMIRGQSGLMSVTVTGAPTDPSAWQAEAPPADLMSVGAWEQKTGAHAPKSSDPGVIYLVLENHSSAVIRMPGGARLVVAFHERDCPSGTCQLKPIKVQSLQHGAYVLTGNLTWFLKQSVGQPQ